MENNRGQTPSIRSLLSAAHGSRLGHALLLSGRSLTDRLFTAEIEEFFRGVLCISPNRDDENVWACGKCESCLIAKEEQYFHWPHPDVNSLLPEKGSFKMENMRALIQASYRRHALSTKRITVVMEADRLSAGGGGAANALLKLLEEPRPNSYLVLLSDRPDAVLATLRSRCHHFRLPCEAEISSRRQWSEDAQLLSWEALRSWLLGGARGSQWTVLPADDESFWKDRETALSELRAVYVGLWRVFREEGASQLDREALARGVHFFGEMEQLIRSVGSYAQPSLQWLNFRFNARLT